MDAPLTIDEFLDLLDRLDIGEYDDRLTEIVKRADERHDLLLARRSRELRKGDPVRFDEQRTKPKYLRGLVATFEEHDEETSKRRGHPWAFVEAPVDPRFKRFSGAKFRAPINTLKKVDP